VVWSGVNQRVNIKNTDPVFGGFAGEFIRGGAQMEWTAKVGDLMFVSDPISIVIQLVCRNRSRTERIVLPVNNRSRTKPDRFKKFI
jgi:hypothetical protein